MSGPVLIASDRNIIKYTDATTHLTFNVFLTVFVSDHLNEGTLQVNHEALQFTFYSTVPVTA